MGFLEDALSSALAQRFHEHRAAAEASLRLAHENPSLGSVSGAFKDTVLGALLALPGEGFAKAGQVIGGELALAAAPGQHATARLAGADPNSATKRTARAVLERGPL